VCADQATRHIDTLLLLGLPACGKSVIRRYLSTHAGQASGTDLGLGPMVQIDDYAYVAFMSRINEIVTGAGHGPVFLDEAREAFTDMRVWGVLTHLVNEDHAGLDEVVSDLGTPAADWIVGRLEQAHQQVGMPSPLAGLPPEVRAAVMTGIEEEAARFASDWMARTRPEGSTVVVEFSRGGPEGASPPLRPPYGYDYTFALLSPRILRHAAALYVWVTPEQSRERNRLRARPGQQGSTVHHDVPETTLTTCYGMDDMAWLMEHSGRSGSITVHAHGSTYHFPVARFDNRHEVGAFHSDEPAARDSELDDETEDRLRAAFGALTRQVQPASPGTPWSG